jgi:hypothetical protein
MRTVQLAEGRSQAPASKCSGCFILGLVWYSRIRVVDESEILVACLLG